MVTFTCPTCHQERTAKRRRCYVCVRGWKNGGHGRPFPVGHVVNLTHGQRLDNGTPTYRSWRAMLQRCTYPSQSSYRYYGARGITVCDRWKSFANFLADMGERPGGTTLDRREVDGNYEPSNCRWATPREQALNRRPRQAVHAI